ncbi:transposase [Haloactinospora alba]|uniref:transposase n=1 Tax=Haloactinospora alba TaxID=405555 RepID=UPI0011526225
MLAPLRPADAPESKRRADHRRIIDAILFRPRTGIPWRAPLERYDPWETAAGHHRRWRTDGTWQRTADRLRIDANSGEERIANIGSSSVRAHQPGAGAVKKGGAARDEPDGTEARGRFRGGPAAKIHLIADHHRRPPGPGQPRPTQGLARVRFPDGCSGPASRYRQAATRVDRVLGGTACSSKADRVHPRRRGLAATIAQPRDQREHHRRDGAGHLGPDPVSRSAPFAEQRLSGGPIT